MAHTLLQTTPVYPSFGQFDYDPHNQASTSGGRHTLTYSDGTSAPSTFLPVPDNGSPLEITFGDFSSPPCASGLSEYNGYPPESSLTTYTPNQHVGETSTSWPSSSENDESSISTVITPDGGQAYPPHDFFTDSNSYQELGREQSYSTGDLAHDTASTEVSSIPYIPEPPLSASSQTAFTQLEAEQGRTGARGPLPSMSQAENTEHDPGVCEAPESTSYGPSQIHRHEQSTSTSETLNLQWKTPVVAPESPTHGFQQDAHAPSQRLKIKRNIYQDPSMKKTRNSACEHCKQSRQKCQKDAGWTDGEPCR